jgi:hypothetical protein
MNELGAKARHVSLGLLAMLASACSQASEGDSQNSELGDAPNDIVSEENSQIALFSNVVVDGQVAVDLGSLRNVRTSAVIAQIFQKADGVVPQRIFLHHSVDDGNGNEVLYEVDYLNEATTFNIIDRGFLSVTVAGEERIATAGTITITSSSPGSMSIQFRELELSLPSDDGGFVDPVAMEDGSIVGAFERFCVTASNAIPATPPGSSQPSTPVPPGDTGPSIDRTWSTPFCAQYAQE